MTTSRNRHEATDEQVAQLAALLAERQAADPTVWVLVDDYGRGAPSVGPFDSYEEAVDYDPTDDRFEPREMPRDEALAALAIQ